MAVETLAEFPASFFAGDTVRVAISGADCPSTTWTLKVLLQSAIETKTFTAYEGTGTAYELLIPAGTSAKIAAGFYVVSFLFTEISSGERQTGEVHYSVTVFADPSKTSAKSIARQTLEAMQAALLKLVSGKGPGRLSVNFNGHSYTNKNLKEFQDAIEQQKAVVQSEEVQLTGHRRIARILHPL